MIDLRRYLIGVLVVFFSAFGGTAVAQTSVLAGATASNAGDVLELVGDTYAGDWGFSNYDAWYAWNPFTSNSGTFSGSVGSWVYTGADGSDANRFNPYNTLTTTGTTFLYQFRNNASSTSDIERLTVDGFAGVQTSVAWTYQLAGVSMFSMDRSSGTGDVMATSWSGVSGVSAGQYGHMIVFTDATTWGRGTAYIIDGGIASQGVLTPGGTTPIPEPETYAMLLAGLGLMGFIARRRRQNAAA